MARHLGHAPTTRNTVTSLTAPKQWRRSDGQGTGTGKRERGREERGDTRGATEGAHYSLGKPAGRCREGAAGIPDELEARCMVHRRRRDEAPSIDCAYPAMVRTIQATLPAIDPLRVAMVFALTPIINLVRSARFCLALGTRERGATSRMFRIPRRPSSS